MRLPRRSFLSLVASAVALHGIGCSDESTSAGGTVVSGRIAPELLVPGLQVASSRGPSTVDGDRFTTTISDDGVGILALVDGTASVRGFALTFPGTVPEFNLEATALATVFLAPGVTTVDSRVADGTVAAIHELPQFSDYLALLRSRSTTPLEILGGDVDFLQALEEVVRALGSRRPPDGGLSLLRRRSRAVLTNSSGRFLRVIRRDDEGDHVLPDLLSPYGTLEDTIPPAAGSVTYLAVGPGYPVASTLGEAYAADTHGPTAFFLVTLPVVELVGGNRIPTDDVLRILALLAPLPVDALAAAFAAGSPEDVAAALAPYDGQDTKNLPDSSIGPLGEVAEKILHELLPVADLITVGSYVLGMGVELAAIVAYKEHKDNPTQVPLGVPVALLLLARALLLLPSILEVDGNIEGTITYGRVFDG